MNLPVPPEPFDIKRTLTHVPSDMRPRMTCVSAGIPSYLWSYWKTALRGHTTWQEFQTNARRSRFDLAEWAEGSKSWRDACECVSVRIA